MKITPEIATQINELYLKIGVKKKVAEIIGCSPSTVSKYIIPNYVSKESRSTYTFDKPIGNADKILDILNIFDNAGQRLCEYCMLSDEEWEDLKILQKEICI
jgi:hypothetical protein